jgi:hypothetical protein
MEAYHTPLVLSRRGLAVYCDRLATLSALSLSTSALTCPGVVDNPSHFHHAQYVQRTILLILTNLERASKTLMEQPNVSSTFVYPLRIVRRRCVFVVRDRFALAGPFIAAVFKFVLPEW